MEENKELKKKVFDWKPTIMLIGLIMLTSVLISITFVSNYWQTKYNDLKSQTQKLQVEKDALQYNHRITNTINGVPIYEGTSQESELMGQLVEAISNSKSVDLTVETPNGKISFKYEAK